MDTLRQFYNWLIEKVLQCCGNSEDETLDDIGERTHLLRADSVNRPGSANNLYNRNRPEQLHGQIISTGRGVHGVFRNVLEWKESLPQFSGHCMASYFSGTV